MVRLIDFIGVVAVIVGVGLVSVPAACVVGGSLLLLVNYLGQDRV